MLNHATVTFYTVALMLQALRTVASWPEHRAASKTLLPLPKFGKTFTRESKGLESENGTALRRRQAGAGSQSPLNPKRKERGTANHLAKLAISVLTTDLQSPGSGNLTSCPPTSRGRA